MAVKPVRSIGDVPGLVDEFADQRVLSRGFDEFGMLRTPADFVPTLPCNFFRDADGVIQHDMNFAQYTGGTAIYVNRDTGNDTTGNGSLGTPYKTINKAATIAAAGGDAAYCIKVKSDSTFLRDELWSPTALTFTNKTIAVIPDNTSGRINASSNTALTWTAEDNVWKATRSAVRSVYDMTVLDANGIPIPYTGVASAAACKAAARTWYTDGTTVWVNPDDGQIPTTARIIVGVQQIYIAVLLGTSKLYLKNITMLGAGTNDSWSIRGDLTGATTVGEFCADGCNFVGSDLIYDTASRLGNCIAIAQLKSAYFFDCKAAYGRRDGFNFHYELLPAGERRKCLGLMYGCESYSQGLVDNSTSNNAFTSHDGGSALLIDCLGYNTKGAVCININGCYSVLYDCNMYNSTAAGNAVYNFATDTPPAGLTAKAVLYNCTHTGETLGSYDLHLDTSTKAYLYGSALTPSPTSTAQPTTVG